MLVVISAFFILPKLAFATDTSSLSPATMADDSSIGTVAWTNVDNAKVSDNVYATAQSFCFVAGTKIKTAKGEVNIESLKKGQYVLGFDLNEKVQSSKVMTVGSREVDDIVVVKTDSGSVTTTLEHPFYVGGGKFEEIKDIKVGDYLYDNTFKRHKLLSKTIIHKKTIVYNLAVDKTHTYFANNFAVHNKSTWHYLKATDFGFAIPSGSTIDGIRAEIEFKSNANNGVGSDAVHIVKNGAIGSTNKGPIFSNNFPLSDTSTFYGSSADLWGETWTADDINNANFGFAFSVDIFAEIVSVDHMAIVVSYTPPLYWYQTGIDSNWQTLAGNWWTDEAHTSAALALPTETDSVVTLGTTSPEVEISTWVAPASINSTATGISITNSSSTYSANFSTTVTGPVTMSGRAQLGGTIDGDVSFHNTSRNYGTITSGHVVDFYDNTINVRAINGTVTFHDSSLNSTVAAITGTVVFNDSSQNYTLGTISGDATFNDSSINQHIVTGTATFNGDLSENLATADTGTSTRRYTSNIAPSRDFITTGPWTILADGAQVDLGNGAAYNASTTLSTANGGSFTTTVSGCGSVYQTIGNTIYVTRCGLTSMLSTTESTSNFNVAANAVSGGGGATTTLATSTIMLKPIFLFLKNLKFKDENTDVFKLQQFLKDMNYFPVMPNGYFGPTTRANVIKFQKLNKLPRTGFFGPLTRGVVNKGI